jgi:hypothetical protein
LVDSWVNDTFRTVSQALAANPSGVPVLVRQLSLSTFFSRKPERLSQVFPYSQPLLENSADLPSGTGRVQRKAGCIPAVLGRIVGTVAVVYSSLFAQIHLPAHC